MKLVATTFYGLEQILAKEIAELGGQNIAVLNRAISFEGDLETLYRINHKSRLAIRVLKPFLSFKAHNETVLYKRLRRHEWPKLFHVDQTFAIHSTVHSKIFAHSRYVTYKVKDAILDEFRLHHDGVRPSIDLENPDVIIDLHCSHNQFTLSLDSSGDPLFKRGYRQGKALAPLNEVLAAGMIKLCGWDGKTPLVDPMCGSGTLLLEAGMISANIPPRKNRSDYALMKWSDFDQSLWQKITEESNPGDLKSGLLKGYDKDEQALKTARQAAILLGLDHLIKFEQSDFFNLDLENTGTLITNPPYGNRIEQEDIEDFYKRIGDRFKNHYQGWTAWILSGNKEALKNLGLRTSKKLTLYNGPTECKFHKYEMYKGSLKEKHKNKK